MNDWVKWNGGECPVEPDAWVDLRMRPLAGVDIPYAEMPRTYRAGSILWLEHEGTAADIIAYRIISPLGEESPS